MHILIRQLIACLFLVLLLSACGVTAPIEVAAPSPSPFNQDSLTEAEESTPQVASVTASPTLLPQATPTTTLMPEASPTTALIPEGQLAIYTHPDGLWSIAYPPNLVHIEERPNGLVVFTSREGNVFLAVDSYQAPASEFGNTGENLRNRARDVLPQLVGGELSQVDFREGVGPWDSGVVFSTTNGMQGQAFYQQPEQPTDPFPVYGVLYGYPAAAEAAVLPLLESMRDSFIPRQPTAPSASQPSPAASDATPTQEAPPDGEMPNTPSNSGMQRIQFEPGETSAVVEGAVVRGTTNQYVLGAMQGQMMTMTITSPEQNAVFTLYGPNGQALEGAAEGQDAVSWSGVLPSTGDYIINVGSTRGNATYTLDVTIAP